MVQLQHLSFCSVFSMRPLFVFGTSPGVRCSRFVPGTGEDGTIEPSIGAVAIASAVAVAVVDVGGSVVFSSVGNSDFIIGGS